MADDAIIARERTRQAALDRLTAQEMVEYERHQNSGKPDLSPAANKRLYELFIHGLSVDDLINLNPALSRGVLLKARVDGLWDERREAYIGELLYEVPSKVKQMAAEALGFLALQLAVAHKEHGEKMKKYLMTGNPADLGGFRIMSGKDYKTAVESLTRLLDAGKPKAAEGGGAPLVNMTVQAAPGSSVSVEQGGHRWSPEDADAIRAQMEKKGQ